MNGCRGIWDDVHPLLSLQTTPVSSAGHGIPMSGYGERSDPQFFSSCDPDKMSFAYRAGVVHFIHREIRTAVDALRASIDMVHCQPRIPEDGIPDSLLPGEIKSFHMHRTQATDVDFNTFHFSSTGICDFTVDDIDDAHDDGQLMHGQSFLEERFTDSLYAAKITPASSTAVSVACTGSEK